MGHEMRRLKYLVWIIILLKSDLLLAQSNFGVTYRIGFFNQSYIIEESSGVNVIGRDESTATLISRPYDSNSFEGVQYDLSNIRFPIGIYIQEDIGKYSFSGFFFDFDSTLDKNAPPTLKKGNYLEYILEEKFGENPEKDFFRVENERTNKEAFYKIYPEEKPYLESTAFTTFSSDTKFSFVMLGYQYGLFYPINERNRIVKLGLGIGGAYTDSIIDINKCSEYRIYREKYGECIDKEVIETIEVKEVLPALSIIYSLYEYEDSETKIGVFEGKLTQMTKISGKRNMNITMQSVFTNIISYTKKF
jgi:hypothetical protein